MLGEVRCPPNDVLKKWLFKTPATAPGPPAEIRKEQAKAHMAIGRPDGMPVAARVAPGLSHFGDIAM